MPPLKTKADYIQWKYNLDAVLETEELLDLVNAVVNVPGAQLVHLDDQQARMTNRIAAHIRQRVSGEALTHLQGRGDATLPDIIRTLRDWADPAVNEYEASVLQKQFSAGDKTVV